MAGQGMLTKRLLEAPDLLETITPCVVDAWFVSCPDCIEFGIGCTLSLRSSRDRGPRLGTRHV